MIASIATMALAGGPWSRGLFDGDLPASFIRCHPFATIRRQGLNARVKGLANFDVLKVRRVSVTPSKLHHS
jgi:hypothetical protein